MNEYWLALEQKNALTIDSATGIDNTPVGASGPSTGAFTSLVATGLVTHTGVEDNLTAHAGGGQASALALSTTKNYHRVSTVATAADSVALPAATGGQAHYVRNDGVNPMQVFGTSPDTINGVATGTGISVAAGTGVWFVSTTAAKWTTSFNSSAPGDIGQTTAAKGAFTTLAASGLLDISAAGAGQAKFPATQNASANANTLDDYSEQTTTPTPTSGTGTLTTASSSVETTKIGNRVFVSAVVTISAAGTGGQDLRVTMPYTAGTITGGSGQNLSSFATLAVRASGSTLIFTDSAGAFPGAGTYTVGVQFRVF